MSRVLCAVSLVALALPLSAQAGGTISVSEKLTWPAYVWVDGQPVGKIKKSHTATVDAGVHEVWIAADEGAVHTYCHGLVEVTEGGVVEVLAKAKGCEGLRAGELPEATASLGTELSFSFAIGDNFAFMVSVDGGMAQPLGPVRTLNLAPGEHHLVFTTVGSDVPVDKGIVTAEAGAALKLTCGLDSGCLGLRHP